ncbi:ATP-binding cassette domain-containing protein [Bacillus mangrovi]|uniref:ATP-binding cassette domain-containing protein n=1 Tax=Metabacillus mangrovi TaxID=1491830 RepID=A0A7X2S956_9BACI|nr:ABC transporter ATP-binding protein [Metabacillus mangrovi]MTH55466.1 ATP-binding cassette domain-containing protein [Metabacillus mangrovi]
MNREKVLEVRNLSVGFTREKTVIDVVKSVDLTLNKGEILGVVGESGCGKSVTSMALMGLLPNTSSVRGEILYKQKDLLKERESSLRKIRGNELAMIFQEPMTSLNPLLKIGEQLMEACRIHTKCSKKEAREQAVKMLGLVGMPRPESLLGEYPHQLSGGMRQRVMIAMAMICNPEVLIADEPTTALDVTIQSQILALMKDLNKKLNTSILLITHDLGVVAQICDRIAVMYAGQVVETGSVEAIFANAKHPYTRGLLQSVPDIRVKKERLFSIKGQVPKPGSIRQGCSYANRCEFVQPLCIESGPGLKVYGEQQVRCWLYEEEGALVESAIARD